MSRQIKVLLLLLMVAFLSASKCGPCPDIIDEETEKTIIGKWQCNLDAYGEPWDNPLIFQFYPDGTGYQ